MATEQVRGLSQLLANLKALPPALVSRNGGLVRRNLFKSAKIVRDEARLRAPVLKKPDPRRRAGIVRDNIIAMRDRNPQRAGANEIYSVGVRKVKVSASKLRKIRKALGGSRAARIEVADDPFFWRFVEFGTSKMRAQSFLRAAFEAKKQQALDVFQTGLSGDIQRLVDRMPK